MSTSTIWYDALSTSRVSVGRQSIRSDKSDPVGSIDVEKDKKAVKKLMSEKRYLEACHLLGRCLKLAEDPSEITRLPLLEDLCSNMHGFYLVMDIIEGAMRPAKDVDRDLIWIHVPLKNDPVTKLYWRKPKKPKKVEFQFHTMLKKFLIFS